MGIGETFLAEFVRGREGKMSMGEPEAPRASREAFDSLVLVHADRLKAIAYAYLKDDAEAEDVLQTAYLKAWKHWSTVGRSERIRPWIERVVRNESVDRWRRRRLERPGGRPVDRPDRTETVVFEEPGASPQADSERQLREVQSIVSTLPEPYRSVVIMRYVQRLSYEQIALELDEPLGTVKTRLCRAIRRIRTQLADGMSEEQ
jgi:RNA polymerase sigma-70 factor (ECF subfamily)